MRISYTLPKIGFCDNLETEESVFGIIDDYTCFSKFNLWLSCLKLDLIIRKNPGRVLEYCPRTLRLKDLLEGTCCLAVVKRIFWNKKI